MQTQLFIGGRFVPAANGETLASLNPHDNSVIAEVAMAGPADVDRAVAAAKAAFPKWSNLAAMERGRLLLKLADAIEANADMLARLESLDTGHPIRDTRNLDVPRTAATFRYFGGMADKFEGSVIPVEQGFLNYMTREPVGIVGQVVPWNFPLMFTSWKMAPALAAGNCVIMKPAELTPLSSLAIAELMAEVGFPEGVVNILPGLGHVTGQYIAEHPEISKVAFTGSTAVGRKIVQASSGNLKKVQLELGGKGANIVFGDANIDAVVQGSAFAIFHNQGQACIAGSRMIVHESIADEVLEKFTALSRTIRIGNPLDPLTEMGPLTSRQHRDRVLSFVDVAREQGGRVLAGGKAPDDAALANGCYVEPTIVEAKPEDRVSQEEVFGPFMTVTRFRTDEEALAIANGTEYGLGAGLWTRDLQRAHLVAREIRAGMVWINCYKRVSPASPFGGVGASGYGREMGFEAMREYTQPKSVWVNVDAQIPPYYPR
ncbi:NADP/NAD-dependent aldehyde dehydrogenase PuuC [Paraburkholderia domus]|jgi:NAD-dependent aldehyde dehydrogenases|uniref:NADP/NAD-dependent aldehyde dehydrogenase PuuC n=1 Tax=Paraburkholderia domus TaxID=2793075 RepID=A0A9N8NGT7_9BURK|nr:aldehyde dehydrogenase family protein [Paraburkholderia domus]MBK5054478.1 aldehyde dehydrogenase family protein [Burkholderia sp. R-70006]MBK5066071.1 aldehyde dehydrogenase family protein [Burkholderia sp. R-70199]MBK5091495.1 aldehyde dehydrogenase family protein [Burkholderia sp. R-69927]MBK5125731.1 aldehyde dehydrogenase family protein [Burkholderia sp. R-69980]MBK5169918.1 aldehyde dehydrogenase family protein [Burkholderia sp. R-70211]MBK5186089.1 aldehyde dehydrogenase family prot